MRKLALIVLFALPALAHDFWIEPSTFTPAPATPFTASLRVGVDFVGDPVGRSSTLIDSFVVRDATGDHDIAGLEGRDPAGYLRLTGGTGLIRYRSKGSELDQTPTKFAQFLREEGLEHVVRRVPTNGHHERFYRYAKAIVGTGRMTFSAAFGDRLELVPVRDPRDRGPLSMQLLFEKKPLAGALVTALSAADGSRVSDRTDSGGRVSLMLPRAGVWLVKSTYLVAAPPSSGAEWESLWASVTFSR